MARRVAAGLSVALLGAVLALVSGQAPAAAAWSQPAFVRSIGGDGVPAVYPWGIQYNPVSNQVVVSDYLNFQVRRYDLAGNPLGNSYHTPNQGQPYSVAVDPIDGDIYVPEIRDGGQRGWIAKYDKNGAYLWSFRVSVNHYNAWIATDSLGRLYVLDSHYTASNNSTSTRNRILQITVNDSTQTISSTALVTNYGNGPGQLARAYGIDIAANGDMWVSDTINGVLHRYSSTGAFIADYGSGVFVGDLRSVAIDDARGRVYVADAAGSRVQVFSTAGAHLGSFGSQGTGPGQFGGGPRQLTVTPDGRVWAADFSNFRVNIFDVNGLPVGTVPAEPRGATEGFMSQPRDVDVHEPTGEVWVADGWNQRVQRFDGATGDVTGAWGRRGAQLPYGFNYPRGIGVDPVTGNVWVSNERGHYIRVFDPTMENVLFHIGDAEQDNTNTGNVRWPMDIEFWNGRAYISDRVSLLVKIFDANTGAEISRISRANHGIAVNPANGDLYVVDPGTDKVYQYNSSGSAIRNWGSTGSGDGQFRFPWDAVVHGDYLYVADSDQSKIQVFSLDGVFQGKWGAYNTGPYDFKNPSGLAVDRTTGLLYVADAGNSRIQVYDLNVPRPPYDGVRPTVTLATPAAGAVVGDAGTYMLEGTAADNVGVGTVGVAIQDTATGLWWKAYDAGWQATKVFNIAGWTGSATTSVDWSFPMNGLARGGSYVAEARVVDHRGTANQANPTAAFTVLASSVEDVADPDTALAVPAASQSFLANQAIVFSGSASDDVGVAAVRVAVGQAGQWLQPGGTWAPTFAWADDADLDATGSPTTGWTWTPPALAPGGYSVTVQAVDLADKIDATRPVANFTIAPADTTAPTGTLTSPAPGGSVTQPGGGAPLPITGTAADGHSVVAVDVAIKNPVTGLWLQPSGTWASAFAYRPATLASPGATSTGWSIDLPNPQVQNYGIQARARDTIGNAAVFRTYTTFTVQAPAPADGAPPTGQLVSPATNATVPFAPVTLEGTAADDVAVAAVEVAVRDVTTGLWLQSSGTWASTFRWLPATLGTPGGASTTWSREFTPPNHGKYGVQARARDSAAKVSTIRTYTTFNVA